jgi:hypothetical protein
VSLRLLDRSRPLLSPGVQLNMAPLSCTPSCFITRCIADISAANTLNLGFMRRDKSAPSPTVTKSKPKQPYRPDGIDPTAATLQAMDDVQGSSTGMTVGSSKDLMGPPCVCPLSSTPGKVASDAQSRSTGREGDLPARLPHARRLRLDVIWRTRTGSALLWQVQQGHRGTPPTLSGTHTP